MFSGCKYWMICARGDASSSPNTFYHIIMMIIIIITAERQVTMLERHLLTYLSVLWQTQSHMWTGQLVEQARLQRLLLHGRNSWRSQLLGPPTPKRPRQADHQHFWRGHRAELSFSTSFSFGGAIQRHFAAWLSAGRWSHRLIVPTCILYFQFLNSLGNIDTQGKIIIIIIIIIITGRSPTCSSRCP